VNNQPDLGMMYVLAYGTNPDGTPDLVPGQNPIIDVLPGNPGYSDLWQINLVTVTRFYQPNSIKSLNDINANDLTITPTNTLVNRPIVPAGSSVEGNLSLTQAWFQDQPVYYFDLGTNPDTTVPIYFLITGLDIQGNPVYVQGQQNIFEFVQGESGYSAFGRVNLVTVPDGYTPNSLRSVADIQISEYSITTTDTLINVPVITQVSSVPPSPTPAPSPSPATEISPSAILPSELPSEVPLPTP